MPKKQKTMRAEGPADRYSPRNPLSASRYFGYICTYVDDRTLEVLTGSAHIPKYRKIWISVGGDGGDVCLIDRFCCM